MTDRLSDRIRAERDISRVRAFNRLTEADDRIHIYDQRRQMVRNARRREAIAYLKFAGALLLGAAILASIFLLQFTMSGGFLK